MPALASIHVERMKEIVIMMVIAMKVTSVELIIAEVCLVLSLFMIVATVKKWIFALWKIPVQWMKVIVIPMMCVWRDSSVD